MYEQDSKQDVGVVSLAIHAKGDSKMFTFWGRVTHRKVGPHDTEGVQCTLARFFIGHVWDCTRGYSTRCTP